MNKFYTLLILCLALNIAAAQTAPDFTVTTLQGEEFNLYTELNKGKTIVIDIFFVNCTSCNEIAPYIQEVNMNWGDGNADVEFISLSDKDNNEQILPYEALHSLTFPAAGKNAGSAEALAPYITSTFGTFVGYPTLVVISPDRTVNFDVWGIDNQDTADQLDAAIEASGATGQPLSVFEAKGVSDLKAFPNPVFDELQVKFQLDNSSDVIVYVMDVTGKNVIVKQAGRLSTGEQTISIDFQNQSSGTYFIELRNGDKLLSSLNVVK